MHTRPKNNADGSDLLTILLDIQDRLSKVETKLDSIDSEIKELKEDLSSQRKYTDTTVGELKEDIRDRLDKIEGRLNDIEDRVSKLEQFRASVSGASGLADKFIGFAIGVLSTMVAWLMYLRG